MVLAELPLRPSTINCLSWSEDGEAALISDEDVTILLPKSPPTERFGWEASSFQSGIFTTQEWPSLDPLNNDDFSIGEEQSVTVNTAIAWSPTGLAKHRHAILAVLTNNLLLSLWDNASDHNNSSAWKRVFIVNSVLKSYFWNIRGNDDLDDEDATIARQSRVRSFIWSPALHLTGQDRQTNSSSQWGVSFLAVANDNNDIVFIRLHQPYIPFSRIQQEWKAEVLCHFSLDEESKQHSNGYSTLANSMGLKKFINHMAWSHWTASENTCPGGEHLYTSVFAYIVSKRLYLRELHATIANDVSTTTDLMAVSLKASQSLPCCSEDSNVSDFPKRREVSFCGPLQWYSPDEEPVSVGNRCLAAIAGEGIVIVEVGSFRVSKFTVYTHYNRDDEVYSLTEIVSWHGITGLAFSSNFETGEVLLHLSSFFSGVKTFIIFSRSGDDVVEKGCLPYCTLSALEEDVQDISEEFRAECDIEEVLLKSWGLACDSSNLIACFTAHPNDMIEYRLNNEAKCWITQVELHQSTKDRFGQSLDNASYDAEEVLRQHLAFILDGHHDLRDRQARSIFYATACVGVLEFSSHKKTIELCKAGFSLLDEMMPELQLQNELEICNSILDGREGSKDVIMPHTTMFDTCDLCGQGIAPISINESRCASGHEFSHCSLTFLAIQRPGISKYCRGCHRQYLNELCSTSNISSKRRGDDNAGEDHDGDASQLINILFRSNEVCLYCKHKFDEYDEYDLDIIVDS